MTKFTPGPWKAIQISGWEFAIKSDGTVARLSQKMDFPVGYDGTVQGRSENKMKADANLIAAAPDMYEVLERIADKLVSDDGVVTGIDAADAVIVLRKARGEE